MVVSYILPLVYLWHHFIMFCNKLCTDTFCGKFQGFVSAVSIMRDFVPAIYDTTVIVPKDSPQPTMLRILKGQPSVVCLLT